LSPTPLVTEYDIKVIGHGKVIPEGFTMRNCPNRDTKIDIKPILADRKMFKFFSKQDALTLLACHRAWEMASIQDENYGERTGIYLCVGILPFEDKPLDKIAKLSQDENGKFDMKRSSTDSFHAMNPLLTFKCLPNMPLYHLSKHLQVTGRYFMTYPGIPEWFCALRKAMDDLTNGVVDYAIVGSAADQKNYLVEHHLRRINPALLNRHIDSASSLVLTSKDSYKALGRITRLETCYTPFNPLEEKEILVKSQDIFPAYLGVVEPSLYLDFALVNQNVIKKADYKWQGNADNYCHVEMEL
jgi:hypothetical protein